MHHKFHNFFSTKMVDCNWQIIKVMLKWCCIYHIMPTQHVNYDVVKSCKNCWMFSINCCRYALQWVVFSSVTCMQASFASCFNLFWSLVYVWIQRLCVSRYAFFIYFLCTRFRRQGALFMHCSYTVHETHNHFIHKKILKMDFTILFTYLKIILVQCF